MTYRTLRQHHDTLSGFYGQRAHANASFARKCHKMRFYDTAWRRLGSTSTDDVFLFGHGFLGFRRLGKGSQRGMGAVKVRALVLASVVGGGAMM
jgi:hypothetical protein